MERYANRSGGSNVAGYEIGNGYIRVQFRGTAKIYTYSYGRAGQRHVDTMCQLARNGSGLNSYINLHVKYLYDI